MDWTEQYPEEIEGIDEFIETYRNWKIYLCIPNGGILGVSVSNGIDAYSYLSEFEPDGIDRYHDETWHIHKAKAFINSQVTQLSENCQQLELPISY